jgi:hypothetical protein
VLLLAGQSLNPTTQGSVGAVPITPLSVESMLEMSDQVAPWSLLR